MAKKEIMKINYSVSACKGTFDKNENGEYIIIVDGTEYLFDAYSQYFQVEQLNYILPKENSMENLKDKYKKLENETIDEYKLRMYDYH